MCFAAEQPVLGSFQARYLEEKGSEIFHENGRKQNSFKQANTEENIFSCFLGQEGNGVEK